MVPATHLHVYQHPSGWLWHTDRVPLPPPPPPIAAPAPVTEQAIAHPQGESFLFTPASCQVQACPLVVVSHTRGRTAADFRASPFVRRYLDAFLARGFAVLLSNDAGPRTWGGPATLAYLADVHDGATRRLHWNGRTYAFGISMGGLPALRSALGGPYPVSGVALLDAHVSTETALHNASDPSRQAEVAAAYGLPDLAAPLPPDSDPLALARALPPLPLFIAGSPDDAAVPFAENGLDLYPHARPEVSRLVVLRGPHLGGSHFAPELVAQLADFFARLEREGRTEALHRK